MKYKTDKLTNFEEIKRKLEEIYSKDKGHVSVGTYCSPITNYTLGSRIKIDSPGLEAEVFKNFIELQEKGTLTQADKEAIDYLREQYPSWIILTPERQYWKNAETSEEVSTKTA